VSAVEAAIELLLGLWWLKGGKGTAAQKKKEQPSPGPMPPGVPSDDASSSPAASSPAAAPAPVVTPIAEPSIPWPSGPVPASLPAFPGPGWEPDDPPTPEVSQRATYWNGFLWDQGKRTMRKPFVQENLGGRWLTFAAAWHPGDKGPRTLMATEAWRVKQVATAPVVAPAPAAPTAPSSPASSPAPASPAAPDVMHVLPYPGPGAWQHDASYITRYQTALAHLGFLQMTDVDGKYGPHTKAAVIEFQKSQTGLIQDGEAGQDTAAALDAALGHTL